jgi:hypothetical protein
MGAGGLLVAVEAIVATHDVAAKKTFKISQVKVG